MDGRQSTTAAQAPPPRSWPPPRSLFLKLAATLTGAGSALAAMLFMNGADGQPRYTAQEALALVAGASGARAWAAGAGRWAKLFRRGD